MVDGKHKAPIHLVVSDVAMPDIDRRTASLPKPFSMELLFKFVRCVIDGDLRPAP